jgi:hypothetical protein
MRRGVRCGGTRLPLLHTYIHAQNAAVRSKTVKRFQAELPFLAVNGLSKTNKMKRSL